MGLLTCKNRRPYNLYCVGGDVKHYLSIRCFCCTSGDICRWFILRRAVGAQVSYLIVDQMHEKLPDVLQDKFWDSVGVVVPYTKESEPFHTKPFYGSVVDIKYVYAVVLVNCVFACLFLIVMLSFSWPVKSLQFVLKLLK